MWKPYAKVREEFSEHRIIISDFLAFMREQSRRKVAKKEEGLFNLCVFNPPEGAEDYRTLEHFQSASGLVLDMNGGVGTQSGFAVQEPQNGNSGSQQWQIVPVH